MHPLAVTTRITSAQTSLSLTTTIGSYNGAPGIGAGEPFNTQLGLKIIF